jgi:hypothetical protein
MAFLQFSDGPENQEPLQIGRRLLKQLAVQLVLSHAFGLLLSETRLIFSHYGTDPDPNRCADLRRAR